MSAKPSEEEIARRRLEKQARKETALPKTPPKTQKKRANDPRLEAEALGKWGLQRVCVDIGANLQSRCSYEEVERQVQRAALANVGAVVLTGCDVEGSLKGRRACEEWASRHAEQRVLFTAGVHPHEASTWSADAEAAVRDLATSPFLASLGECGLDYDRMLAPRDTQQATFRAQARLAKELKLPLFVHCRERDAAPQGGGGGGGEEAPPPLGAYADAVDILRESNLDPKDVCVHCFTGNADDLKTVLDYGAFVGLTGFVGIQKRSQRTAAALRTYGGAALLGRLMIETDSPFMSPDKSWLPTSAAKQLGIRGGKNEPAVLPAVARALAAVLTQGDDLVSPDDVATATTANALTFFRLPRPHAFNLAFDE